MCGALRDEGSVPTGRLNKWRAACGGLPTLFREVLQSFAPAASAPWVETASLIVMFRIAIRSSERPVSDYAWTCGYVTSHPGSAMIVWSTTRSVAQRFAVMIAAERSIGDSAPMVASHADERQATLSLRSRSFGELSGRLEHSARPVAELINHNSCNSSCTVFSPD